MNALLTVLLVVCCTCVFAKDPAQGWMGYATGLSPTGSGRLTHVEAKWKVGNNPRRGGAFFSPWFGIETSDNLNLVQPVNPWTGNHWEMYNEYFQWQPEHNQNSDSLDVSPGDVLHGQVTFDEANQVYHMTHTHVSSGRSVTMDVPVQKTFSGDYKQYTIVYFVMEKVWACDMYPPEGEVEFYDIVVQYEGQTVTPNWSTSYVDDNCNNRAQIVDSSTIKITWDTSFKDNYSTQMEKIAEKKIVEKKINDKRQARKMKLHHQKVEEITKRA